MDFKDLMVGDLVYVVRGYDKHLTIEKIKGVIEDEDKPYPVTIFTGETVSLNDIKPIPLTEDILEKNGFSYEHEEETCSTCSYHHWQLVGEYLALDDCQYWRKEKKDDLPRFRIAGIDINYVHQLQHLLRLCGIEKELVID